MICVRFGGLAKYVASHVVRLPTWLPIPRWRHEPLGVLGTVLSLLYLSAGTEAAVCTVSPFSPLPIALFVNLGLLQQCLECPDDASSAPRMRVSPERQWHGIIVVARVPSDL